MNAARAAVWMLAMALIFTAGLGCGPTAPPDEQGRQNLEDSAQVALNEFKRADPSLNEFLNRAYGYVVFPSVGKGGLIVGGAHGRGIVYEQGQMAGFAELTQANVGFLAGGQQFRELVVFGTRESFLKFRNGQLSLGADASAVALKEGAAASAQFRDGIAVFTKPSGGLMFDVSLNGQKFNYVSNENAPTQRDSDVNRRDTNRDRVDVDVDRGGRRIEGDVRTPR